MKAKRKGSFFFDYSGRRDVIEVFHKKKGRTFPHYVRPKWVKPSSKNNKENLESKHNLQIVRELSQKYGIHIQDTISIIDSYFLVLLRYLHSIDLTSFDESYYSDFMCIGKSPLFRFRKDRFKQLKSYFGLSLNDEHFQNDEWINLFNGYRREKPIYHKDFLRYQTSLTGVDFIRCPMEITKFKKSKNEKFWLDTYGQQDKPTGFVHFDKIKDKQLKQLVHSYRKKKKRK